MGSSVVNTVSGGISGTLNDIANGTISATDAVANGSLSALDAMENGVLYTTGSLDDNFQDMIDDGLITALDAFSYLSDLAVYNGTGNYYGTNNSDVIIAVDILGFLPGFSLLRQIWGSGQGKIYAKDGDDTIIMASFAATVFTGAGNDAIYGGSAALFVEDTTGNLIIGQASVLTSVNKTGDGNITFGGVSGLLNVNHSGGNGDISAYSIAAANHIDRSGENGDVTFYGLGIGNIINHSVTGYGKVEFYGGGGANVITASGNHTDIDFYGTGNFNVIVNTASKGDMNIYALGKKNLVVKVGDGNLNTYLASYDNVVVHIGNGDSKISLLGGHNTYTKVGDGDIIMAMAGFLNFATVAGDGDLYGVLSGIGNIVTKKGTGDMYLGLTAAGNVVSHIDNSGNNSDTRIIAQGGANVVTKKGNGDLSLAMVGVANVATHIGDGNLHSAQISGASILTKIGDGDVHSVQLGSANILTQRGNGDSLAMLGGTANVVTKIGDGLTATVMLGGGANVFTHIGNGSSYAFMSGIGNIFTKVGGTITDKTMAAMFGTANVFTHIGDGTTAALMFANGNIFTKVGDGPVIAALIANANIVTHVGDGDDYVAMSGSANLFTKVGDGRAVALMSGTANIATHIGDGDQINLVTGQANIISKLGQGDQVSVAVGTANIITHIDLVGQSDSYNFTKGDYNLITKIGDGMQVSGVFGKYNAITHVGNGDAYQLVYGGEINAITKVGDGNLTVGLIDSTLNLVTQVGDGDAYYGMWGDVNIATKVGDGKAVVAIKGDLNILTNVGDGQQFSFMTGDVNINTKVGDGDSINIINGDKNLVTKVGDGLHLAAMKGEINVNLHMGDGMTISAMHAKNNLTVKVGNGDFYGLSIAKSDSSFSEMISDLFSQISQTASGYIASDIIGQLVWGPEEQQSSQSDSPTFTNSETTDPNINTTISTTSTETSEFALNEEVNNVENSNIDVNALPEDASNPELANASTSETEYSTLTEGVDIVTDGSVYQRKLKLADSNILQGHATNIIVGDFNGDGRDDMIRQEKNGWDNDNIQTADMYLAKSNGTFVRQALTNYTIMKGDGTNIIVGDYNGDGIDDFIRQEKNGFDNDDILTADMYLAKGDGTFTAQALTDFTTMKGSQTNIIIGDYNGDGKDDFIRQEKFAMNDGDNDTAHIYLSDGDGTFTGQALSGNMLGDHINIIIGDFNGDGKDDYIEQKIGAGAAALNLSNGDGTFSLNTLTDGNFLKENSTNILVGDFNGDGRDDFIRQEKTDLNDGNEVAKLYLSNEDNSFRDYVISSSASYAGDVANLIIGDYNGDGKDDFLRQEKGILDDDNISTGSLYLSNGDGSFTWNALADDASMKGDETNLIIGDYDGDGVDDIIRQEIVNLADGRDTASLYSNKKIYNNVETTTDPNFDGFIKQVKVAIEDSFNLKGDQTNIIAGDFNGDGKDDFIRQEKGSADDDNIYTANLFMSNGDGTFSQQLMTNYDDLKGSETTLIIGDYNGDGKDDFIRQERNNWDNDTINTASIYLSNGDGTFTYGSLTHHAAMKGDVTNIIVGDYNGDGRDDFIRQEKYNWHTGVETIVVYLSDGNGAFTPHVRAEYTSLQGNENEFIIGDYNGDGKDDFIRQEKGAWQGTHITTYLSDGDGSFTDVTFSGLPTLNGNDTILTIGDFNGDGKDDFIRREKGALDDDNIDTAHIYLSNGDGTFTGQLLANHANLKGDNTILKVGDFNGDGFDDFIRREKGSAANDDINTANMYLSNGDGTFTNQDIVDDTLLKGDLTNLIIADYDGDGKDDYIRQEKGVLDDDHYNSANLYLNKNYYGVEEVVAPASTLEEDFEIKDDIAASGNSSVSDSGASEGSSSVSQGDADINSLRQEGDDNANQANQTKTDLASDSDALSNYLTNLSNSYSLDSSQTDIISQSVIDISSDKPLHHGEVNIIIGDYNGDGRDDFIRQEKGFLDNDRLDDVDIFLSNADGSFVRSTLAHQHILPGDHTNMIVGDYNGDGMDDFIRQEKGGYTGNNNHIYLSNGDGTFGRQFFADSSSLNGHNVNIIVGDYNGDGNDDFIRQEKEAWNDNGIRTAEVHLSNGDGTFTKQLIIDHDSLKGDYTNIIVGDYNGDGRDDFIRQEKDILDNDGVDNAHVFLGNADGSFTKSDLMHQHILQGDHTNLIVGDYNGDGMDDFIRQEKGGYTGNNNHIYLSTGGGNFARQSLTDSSAMNGHNINIIVGDYNGDGKDDFIRQEKTTLTDGIDTQTVYLSNGDGTFTLNKIAGNLDLQGDFSNIIIGDYDGDGDDDFIGQKNSDAQDIARVFLNGNGDAARSEYNIGIGNIDAQLQDAEDTSTAALTDAQTNTDNAESELSETDLNADQANSDATASQIEATTAQNDATTQESQVQSDATSAENKASSAESTAIAQSGSDDINDTDTSDREASEGSGLTVDNSTPTGEVFNYQTDGEVISDNENVLLSEEDEEALQEGIQAINNLGSNQTNNSYTGQTYNPVNTSGEGVNGNVDNDNIPDNNADFHETAGGFEEVVLSGKNRVKRTFDGQEKDVQPVSGDFSGREYIKVYDNVLKLIESGDIKLDTANEALLSSLITKLADNNQSNALESGILTKESLLAKAVGARAVADKAHSLDYSDMSQIIIETDLNLKINATLTYLNNDFPLGDRDVTSIIVRSIKSGEGNNIKSTSEGGGTYVRQELLEIISNKIADPNISEAEKNELQDQKNALDQLFKDDSATRRSHRESDVAQVYKDAYGTDLDFTSKVGSPAMKAIWDGLSDIRNLTEKQAGVNGSNHVDGKTSINHILSDSSIETLLLDAAYKISTISDATIKTAAINEMKVFFDGVVGVGQFGDVPAGNGNTTNAVAQIFSDKAFNHFESAVSGTGVDTVKLNQSMASISYAPGNVRWGNTSLNSARGNFFDPIFEKVTETINGETVESIELSQSSIAVKQAVEHLVETGLVNKSVGETSLNMDSHKVPTGNGDVSKIYSTTKIINGDGGTDIDVPTADNPVELGEHLTTIAQYSGEHGSREAYKPNAGNPFSPDGDGFGLTIANDQGNTAVLLEQTLDGDGSKEGTSSGKNILEKADDGTWSTIQADKSNGEYKVLLNEDGTPYGNNGEGKDGFFVYEHRNDPNEQPTYITRNANGEGAIITSSFKPNLTNGVPDFSGNKAVILAHGEVATNDAGIAEDPYVPKVATGFLANEGETLKTTPAIIMDSGVVIADDNSHAVGEAYVALNYSKVRPEYSEGELKGVKTKVVVDAAVTHAQMPANTVVITMPAHESVSSQAVDNMASDLKIDSLTVAACRAEKGDTNAGQTHVTKSAALSDDTLKEVAQTVNKNSGNDSAKTTNDKVVSSDVADVKSNSPDIDSDGSNSRQTSYHGTESGSTASANENDESTRGNIQIQVGNGEYVAGFWGDNNLGLKIGEGGFKGAAFGENNVLVHIGNAGNVEYSTNVGGYEAFEGAQLLIGSKNLSFNYGDSNDFIVAIDKSIPLPPFVSPFDGPSNIVGYLKDQVVALGEEEDGTRGSDFHSKQNELWSFGNAESIVGNVSGLDQNSATYYETIFDYGSETDRDTRALQADIEASMNKEFNNWMSPGGEGDQGGGDVQANIVIAGQGADIIMANGEKQFLFGDNIQSVLDTTLSSLFGMATQDPGENGSPTNTMSYDPTLLPQKLQDQMLNLVAISMPEITLGDIFTIDYNANGSIYSSNGASLSGNEMMDVLEVIAQFGNQTISKYLDPEMIMDNIKSSLNLATGASDQIKTTFGLATNDQDETAPSSSSSMTQESDGAGAKETLGFGGLTLPSIFNMADVASSFSDIPKLINDLAGTINSFGGDANNIQDAILEFFTTSGYMTDDGDLMVSLGDSNYSWGGHGNDIGAFLGLNNNFWGGRGDDMFYGLGENNQASGNQGNDTGILLGTNNLFLGGQDDDFALASGRMNNLSGGTGNDSLFAFGSDTWLMGDEGDDYLMSAGLFTTIQAGEGNDYIVSTGHYAYIDGDEGHDAMSIFGNKNTANSGNGNDMIRILGYQSEVNGGSGDDVITFDVKSKNNKAQGSSGDDTFVLGGRGNNIYGETGSDKFLINQNIISNRVKDITDEDVILFDDLDYTELWFARDGDDLEIYVDRGFTDEELSANVSLINEKIGVTYFEDYFLGNASNIVVNYLDDNDYTILNSDSLNEMIAIMETYEVDEYNDGFFEYVSFADEDLILDAWQGVTSYITGDDSNEILIGYDIEQNIIDGGLGDDALFGGSGSDNITGNAGDDDLYGEDGNDIIIGGDGNDVIHGGGGEDTLTGGTNSDIFTFASLEDSSINKSDLITDFTQGEDTINMSNLSFTGITNDQSQTDSDILTYEYDSVNDQTIVSNEEDTFEFKLSGNIALNVNDFDFIS